MESSYGGVSRSIESLLAAAHPQIWRSFS